MKRNVEAIREWVQKPRKPLPRRSAKRIAEGWLREDVVARVIQDQHGLCAAREMEGDCWHPHGTLDVHEIVNRARGGNHLTTDPLEVVALCRLHHDYITDHPIFGEVRGFVLPSWATIEMKVEALLARLTFKGAKPNMPPNWWDFKRINLYWERV